MALKIALYYPYIHLKSGVERTILEILKRSRHAWFVYTNLFQQETTFPELSAYHNRITQLKRISVKRSYLNTLRSAITIFNQRIPAEEFDLLWIHNEGLGSLINFNNKGIPKICFCHTPLKVVYDEELKRGYLRKNVMRLPLYLFFSGLFRAIDRKAFGFYDFCFCVSEEVKRRVLVNGLLPADKVRLIYRGVDTKLFSGKVRYMDYFFHPARIKWWKNIELSIGAFKLFQKKYGNCSHLRLIIAGELYPTNNSYYRKIKSMVSGCKSIILIIDPTQQQLMSLYANCLGVLSTTLNEDFGLTVLEGFSFSKPVIAIKKGGPAEIIEHGRTGFLSLPEEDDLAGYLHILGSDRNLAMEMGRSARNEALRYDWSIFINYIDAFLEEFMAGRRLPQNK